MSNRELLQEVLNYLNQDYVKSPKELYEAISKAVNNDSEMTLSNEFTPIRKWAMKKGILIQGDAKTQTIKLMEEVGELSHGILKNNIDEIEDAIGDIVVVLTSIASFKKTTIEKCINGSYDVISKRTGTMINGNFVKDK